MNDAKVQVKFTGETKNLDAATSKASKSLQGFKSFAKGIGVSIAATTAAALGTATAAIIDIGKQSLQARADLEQNLGGVETLFKKSADKVIKNANEAYKTAGVSANEYMEGVTSFAASLLQSTAGNTDKAADIADMAFKDMSDNANKFGTAMDSIQHAYQGFAKQNYTMLDNLKLGYGGTKTEMERLLSDAEKLTGKKYDISNLSDVYNAIHAIQEKLDVTGTTEKEASSTITGSINAAKAAWQNFLSGTIDTKDLIDTIITAISNVFNEVLKILPDIAKGLGKLINGLIPIIAESIDGLIPVLLDSVITLLQTLASNLPTIIQSLLDGLLQIMYALADAFPKLIPMIIKAILDIIPVLLNNLPAFIMAGVQLIIGLAKGLIDAIPIIVDMIPEIIEALVNGIMGSLPEILFAGVQIIVELGVGLIKAIPKLLAITPKIIQGLSRGLTKGFGTFKNLGGNLIAGLKEGIKNKFNEVVEWIKGMAAKLPKAVKKVLGIASPSKVMFKLGGYTTEGFINGIDSLKPELDRQMVNTFSLSPNVTNSASTHFSPNVNVINNIDVKQDPLGQMVKNIKTFSGGAKNDYNYGKA